MFCLWAELREHLEDVPRLGEGVLDVVAGFFAREQGEAKDEAGGEDPGSGLGWWLDWG